jgi:hypothetical protein
MDVVLGRLLGANDCVRHAAHKKTLIIVRLEMSKRVAHVRPWGETAVFCADVAELELAETAEESARVADLSALAASIRAGMSPAELAELEAAQ